MKYAKIIVKNNYECRGDLVLRSYIRALEKVNAIRFLENGNAVIYGVVDNDNTFYELLTNEIINIDNYVFVDVIELFDAEFMPDNIRDLMKKINEKILFGKDVELGFEVSTIEDLAKDRAIEFEAYDRYLSRINPYQRLTSDNMNSVNDYNNFLRKVEEVNIMRRKDNNRTIEYDEYEVLENPRRLIKK